MRTLIYHFKIIIEHLKYLLKAGNNMADEVTKVTVKEIKFLEGDDTRIYLSDGTQLIGVKSVTCKVSRESGQADYTIKGTIHNFNNHD
jgi:hypothetical protein